MDNFGAETHLGGGVTSAFVFPFATIAQALASTSASSAQGSKSCSGLSVQGHCTFL